MDGYVTTCIRVRANVLAGLKRLAELKRQQQGGRASVSGVLSDLAVAEIKRVERRKEGRADA